MTKTAQSENRHSVQPDLNVSVKRTWISRLLFWLNPVTMSKSVWKQIDWLFFGETRNDYHCHPDGHPCRLPILHQTNSESSTLSEQPPSVMVFSRNYHSQSPDASRDTTPTQKIAARRPAVSSSTSQAHGRTPQKAKRVKASSTQKPISRRQSATSPKKARRPGTPASTAGRIKK